MKKRKMAVRIVLFLVILALAISISGCTKSPKNMILGKWVNDAGYSLEFLKDGTMTGSIMSVNPIPGSYSWVDKSTLEMTCNASDIESLTVYVDMPIVIQVGITTLTEDTLELNFDGTPLSYHRADN
jgi:hypothetical protein